MNIINPEDYIEPGDYNPHNVGPFRITNEFGTICMVYAQNAQDALDIAADEGALDGYRVDEDDLEQAYCFGLEEAEYFEDVIFLGNASEPFHSAYLGVWRVKNHAPSWDWE